MKYLYDNFYHLYRTKDDAVLFAVVITASDVAIWRWPAGTITPVRVHHIPYLNPAARHEAASAASHMARELARNPLTDVNALLASAYGVETRTERRERETREKAERDQDRAVGRQNH